MPCDTVVNNQLVRINRLKAAAERRLKKKIAAELAAAKKRQMELDEFNRKYNPSSLLTTQEYFDRIMTNIRSGLPARTSKIGDGADHVHVFIWNDGTSIDVRDVEYQTVSVTVNTRF